MGSKQHLLATYSHIFCKMLLKIAVYQFPFPHAALLLQCTPLGMMYKLTRYLHSSIVFSRATRAMVSSIKIIASTASRPINSSVVSVLIHFSRQLIFRAAPSSRFQNHAIFRLKGTPKGLHPENALFSFAQAQRVILCTRIGLCHNLRKEKR